MKYCVNCIMPDTKPDLHFEAGLCDACQSFFDRRKINWQAREQTLIKILGKYKSKNSSNWDCIVPISGGKDSHFQVLKMLEYGMNPLAVVATTCHLTSIGKNNINNVKSLGVEVLEFSPNPQIRKKLNRIGLQQIGDISWPEHVSIFTIPVQVATKFQIPLIIWGENSQNEYGGPAASRQRQVLDRRWLEEFGGLLGFRTADIIGLENIGNKNMLPYTYPNDAVLKKTGVTGLFLGYFLPWDGSSNALLAQSYGFETFPHRVETALVNYENLDNYQTGIHDYFKFLKLGFDRVTDQACLQIRRGRLTRKQAVDLANTIGGKFPWRYLDKPLHEILRPLDLTVDEFVKICDKFTNKKLFKTNSVQQLIKQTDGSLVRKYPLR